MKKSIFVLLLAFTATLLSAQRESSNETVEINVNETFDRKGKILVETGYNLIGGLPIGGGTGFTTLTDGDNTINGFGFNGGYFVSQNFALKFSYSTFGTDGSSISSYGVGTKYYIAGKVPIDFGLGIFSAGSGNNSGSDAYGSLTVGYGLSLANNINLEPALGLFADGDTMNVIFNLNFAMFL